MVLEIPEDQTHQQEEVMTNKILMITIYAVPTMLLLVGAYLFTKKR